MLAIRLFCLILGLALAGGAYAQSTRTDGKQPKKATLPSPPPPPKPRPVTRENEYTAPPYRPRTERDYEPWRANRQSTPAPKASSSSTPRTQPVRSTAKPAQTRDPALARCDKYKESMERVLREEQRGGDPARMQRLADERKRIYQDTMRAGC